MFNPCVSVARFFLAQARSQAEVQIERLVDRITFDGDGGSVSITFRPSGIKILAGELTERKEDAA